MLKILRLRKREGADTVLATRSSHNLVPLSSQIGPKLTSDDESYVDIQSISLFDLCIKLVLIGWHSYARFGGLI